MPPTFSLDDDTDATLSNTQVYNPVSPGDYTVTEGAPGGGYAFSNANCVVDVSDPNDRDNGDRRVDVDRSTSEPAAR